MGQTIDIHPVRFNSPTHCSLRDGGYRQFVQRGDETQFQMRLSLCGEENAIKNATFNSTNDWTINSTFWTIDTLAGRAVKAAGGTDTITQSLDSADGVTWVIGLYAEVTGTDGFGVWFVGSGGLVYGGTIATTGYHQFTTTVGPGVTAFQIKGISTSAGSVGEIRAIPVNTDYRVSVLDTDDVVIHTMTPALNPSNFTIVNGFLTFTYDWTDAGGAPLPEGCYYFAVLDPCDCGSVGFVGQDFETATDQWYYPAGDIESFVIGGGIAHFSAIAFSDSEIRHNFDFCEGESYEVAYKIQYLGAGDSFNLFLGNAPSAIVSVDGTYSETLVASGSNPRIRLAGLNTSGIASFHVTDLTIRKVSGYSHRSNLFSLKEDHGCTVYITACCDQNNMSAGYGAQINGTGNPEFTTRIRLKARYGQGGQESVSQSYKRASGYKNSYYYEGDGFKELSFGASMYVHDYIGHLKGYDHVYIDGIEMEVVDEEPSSIAWIDDFDYGERTVRVGPKVSDIYKRQCNSKVSGCGDDSVGVIQDGGDGGGGFTDPGELIVRG